MTDRGFDSTDDPAFVPLHDAISVQVSSKCDKIHAEPSNTSEYHRMVAMKAEIDWLRAELDPKKPGSLAWLAEQRNKKIEEQAETIRSLRDALQPFAAMASGYPERIGSGAYIAHWWPDDASDKTATVGDCRRAAVVMKLLI